MDKNWEFKKNLAATFEIVAEKAISFLDKKVLEKLQKVLRARAKISITD